MIVWVGERAFHVPSVLRFWLWIKHPNCFTRKCNEQEASTVVWSSSMSLLSFFHSCCSEDLLLNGSPLKFYFGHHQKRKKKNSFPPSHTGTAEASVIRLKEVVSLWWTRTDSKGELASFIKKRTTTELVNF